MRDGVRNDGLKRKILPLAAWSLTAPCPAPSLPMRCSASPTAGGAPRPPSNPPPVPPQMKVDSPDGGARTIQLRYDPVVEAVQRELAAAGYYKGWSTA